MKSYSILICLSLVILSLSGCDQDRPEQPPTGSRVTIQFRRDALGSAHPNPVPPTTDSINGAAVSFSGTLSKANRDWIVVSQDGKAHWIPRDVILLIRVNQ